MTISIGSNISALQAQRRLGESTDQLGRTFERLSSGQRINRASDDAAGLAIAETLSVRSRISNQGVRNLNDSVSYYTIAEGATSELKNIIIRSKELAEQSANGVYSEKQRAALDNELQALGAEYNRILASTSFNGRDVFSAEGYALISQAGDSVLATTLTSERAAALNRISLVSPGMDGSDAGGLSDGKLPVSADGRYMVFYSSASNLIQGVGDGVNPQIYRKDLQTGRVELVSGAGTSAGDGGSLAASISADGRYVVFTSYATNLVAGVGGELTSQVFRKDMLTGEIQAVSTDAAGAAGNESSDMGSVSADGRSVVFISRATNLAPGAVGNLSRVYRKDIETGAVMLLSADGSGAPADDASSSPMITVDGRYAIFTSTATNLVAGVSDGNRQVYRKNIFTGAIDLVSCSSTGSPAGEYSSFAASSDGRYVIFGSLGTDLLPGIGDGVISQVYRKDMETGQVRLVSADSSGVSGDSFSAAGSISADGRYVLFISQAANLAAGIGDGLLHYLYAKDMESGAVKCVNLTESANAPLNSVNGEGASGVISADGAHIFLTSDFQDQLDGYAMINPYNVYSLSNPLHDRAALTPFQWVNINSAGEARNALTWFNHYLDELNTFQGDIGSSVSRLEVAKNVLAAMTENFKSAESRIRDADMADESAVPFRTQIVQHAASSVLAQANQAPALALVLLR